MIIDYEKREELHKEICEEIHDLYIRKNRDYGGSVTDTYNKFGLVSFLVRLSDKLNRITNLTINNKDNLVKDEKIQDTLLDLANYSILALIELKMEEEKKSSLTINTFTSKDFTTLANTNFDTLGTIALNHEEFIERNIDKKGE